MSTSYESLKIKEYKHWSVYLHGNQYFLGRVYIWSHRTGHVDLMDTVGSEQKELFDIGREVRVALIKLFKPDLFNWASLGNITQQCHMHVIPRYASERHFAGRVFIDERWGKNYAPYNYDFTLPEEVLEKIREAIKARLNRSLA